MFVSEQTLSFSFVNLKKVPLFQEINSWHSAKYISNLHPFNFLEA